MSCATGQTSAILDCICVNGKPLIDYIDTGDQHLQQIITAIQATITTLQACCTSNSQAIATLQGLITTLQGQITALQTCCTSNTAAITTIQGIITALQAQAHPRLTLTKNQDVANRATLDALNQILNLPPTIAGRLNSLALTVPVGLNNPTVIPGITPDYDTVSGAMATTSGLVIPRTGRYNISGSWGTNQPASCSAYVLGASVFINGAAAGRYTAPSNALADQVALTIPGHLLQAGDTLQLGGYTDCAGVIATSAYLAAEYIEGT